MPSNFNMFGNAPNAQQQLRTTTRLQGGPKRPEPTTSIVSQPGANCCVLTWNNQGPISNAGCYMRIYLDTERHFFAQLPPGAGYAIIPLDGGPTPPIKAIYLSYITPGGLESRKVQIKAQAAAQAVGAPPPPSPPPPAGSPGGGSGTGNGGSGGFRRYQTY